MLLAALTALSTAFSPAAPRSGLEEYALDTGHCIVEFSVGFALIRVKGRFTQMRGTILYDPADPGNSSVSVVMETKSLDTGWPHRDEHLRTGDFFETDKFPTIVFQSERLRRSGDGWTLEGNLTMHGVTRAIAIPFRLLPPAQDPGGSALLTATGAVRLSRKDFGILGGDKYNSWFNAVRNATVADSVDISIELQGWRPDPAQRSPGIAAALTRLKTDGVPAYLDRFRQAQATRTPAQFEALYRGGDLVVRALIADGRMAEAEQLAGGLTQLYPQLAGAWLLHGFVLAAAGKAPAAAQDYARARQVFRPPVRDPNEKFPQDDDAWWYSDQLVRSALAWGRLREAVPLARVLTELYPESARSQLSYGLALVQSGDTAGATAAYAKALQLDAGETRVLEWKRRLKD